MRKTIILTLAAIAIFAAGYFGIYEKKKDGYDNYGYAGDPVYDNYTWSKEFLEAGKATRRGRRQRAKGSHPAYSAVRAMQPISAPLQRWVFLVDVDQLDQTFDAEVSARHLRLPFLVI
jgi:hypothetical protein